MIFLMFLVYFSIPTLLVFAVQYLFCQCRYAAVKLIPTIAAFVFLVWVMSLNMIFSSSILHGGARLKGR